MLALIPGTVFAKKGGGEDPSAINNLSFPAIAVDGFSITPLATPSFTVIYAGDYSGLTADEIAWLQANGPWYPQKTSGNAWQADFVNQGAEDVTYIDWGDNIESVNPALRSTFRLEVTLYKQLSEPMTAYKMAVLENPSSPTELQGTNMATYENSYATVVSARPKMVIQYLGASVPALTWDADALKWKLEDSSYPTAVSVNFAPELNVGGKYIFGASSGGWKPTSLGYYRLTFYIPNESTINLAIANVRNYADLFTGTGEGTAATPMIDTDNNLTFVDVLVKTRAR